MKFLINILLLAVGCANPRNADRIYKANHFQIFYTELDGRNIKEIADSLEAGYPRITSNLQSGDLPIVNVHF